MINGFDINPLTHDLHLRELERSATGTGHAASEGHSAVRMRGSVALAATVLTWCHRVLAWRGVRFGKAATE